MKKISETSNIISKYTGEYNEIKKFNTGLLADQIESSIKDTINFLSKEFKHIMETSLTKDDRDARFREFKKKYDIDLQDLFLNYKPRNFGVANRVWAY